MQQDQCGLTAVAAVSNAMILPSYICCSNQDEPPNSSGCLGLCLAQSYMLRSASVDTVTLLARAADTLCTVTVLQATWCLVTPAMA